MLNKMDSTNQPRPRLNIILELPFRAATPNFRSGEYGGIPLISILWQRENISHLKTQQEETDYIKY